MKDSTTLVKFVNRGTILAAIGSVVILLTIAFATLIPRSADKDWDRFVKSCKGRLRYTPDYPTAYKQMSAQRRMLQNFHFGMVGLICLAAGLSYLNRKALGNVVEPPAAKPTSDSGPVPAWQPGAPVPPVSRSVPADLSAAPAPLPEAPETHATVPTVNRSIPPDLNSGSARIPVPARPVNPPVAAAEPQPEPAPLPPPAPAEPPADPPRPAPRRGWKELPKRSPGEKTVAEPAVPEPPPPAVEPPSAPPRDAMDF